MMMSAKAKKVRESEIKCQQCGAEGSAICRNCAAQQVELQQLEKAAIVGRGTCPQCGNTLIPNLELAGYWTCAADTSETERNCKYEVILDI
jgi:hypothetical protein